MKLQKLSDMGGLQLWIFPNGSKLWRFAYRYQHKQKLLALGRYPDVTLFDARMARNKAKLMLREGSNPSSDRQEKQLEQERALIPFDAIAEEYLAKLERENRSSATLAKVRWLLELASGDLGKLAISTIKPANVLVALRRVEGQGHFETARRLRSTIGAVFRYAIATARAETDPTTALQGALTAPTVKPRAAITDAKAFGALLRAIDDFDGQPTTRAALKLMALLFPRPGELRAARWEEFDLDNGVWVVPPERMKMRRAHHVPLARQALSILGDLRCATDSSSLVFPSLADDSRPISENTMNAALRRLGYASNEMTSHGFRAAASTLLNESGHWHPDAIERQLAHVEANDVRRAYARGMHWEERVRMMTWWADHLDLLRQARPAKLAGDAHPARRGS